jgi:hypothetical protein
VNGVGEQNSSKNTNGRAMRACPTAGILAGILAALAAISRLNSPKYTQKSTDTTSRLPGNGDTAPAMAVLGAFGRDPATPGSALFYFGFCVNNKTNNTHIRYSRDLTGGEGLKKDPTPDLPLSGELRFFDSVFQTINKGGGMETLFSMEINSS